MAERSILLLMVFLLVAERSGGYITWIAVRLPLEGEPAAPGAPWPMPQQWDQSPNMLTLDPKDFSFQSNLEGCDVIDAAFNRYSELLNLDEDGTVDEDLERVEGIEVVVESETSCVGYPQQGFDETYDLSVKSGGAQLSAPTVWGAVRGLETFSQLLFLDDDKKYQINETEIHDFPRFPFRAFLIDTARHFIPLSIILEHLDVMAWNKLNVLHWHVVDDQSFPYPMRTYPNMTEEGSYSAAHRYSREDVTTILEEARLRGIRVIPEFDTPGHTYSWGLSLPRLITPCWGEGLEGGPYVADYPNHGAAEVLNPMDEYVYSVLDEIYEEIVEDFPDEYVHLGMDEAYHACWESNPNISDWMRDMGFTNYNEVEQYYNNRLIDIARSHGAKYIIWQDPIDNNNTVHEDTVVIVWKDAKNGQPGQFEPWEDYMKRIAEKGYDLILAAPWYLNVISYGEDWREYYMIEPTNFTDDPNEKEQVKGGEMTAWAEYIDGSNFLPRMWPRASSIAERLWSASDVTDVDSAAFRLDQQRCRMVRRGIPAQPILPGYCGDYDWGMERRVYGNRSPGSAQRAYSIIPYSLVIWALLSMKLLCM